MQTKNPTKAHLESRTRRRLLSIVVACIAVGLLAGLGVKLWLDHRRRVPPPDAGAVRLARYMASRAFAALPAARKAPYLDAFRRAGDRGELTPEQQREVMGNIRDRSGTNPLQQYFSLPPGKQREEFLDDVIDRVLKEEKLHPRPDEKGPRETPIDCGPLADSIPPQDRAQMGQFLQDLHDRRRARGVADDGKFLFRRAN